MRQFYKYIIYRLYTWAKNIRGDNTPVFNVIITLAFVHYMQIITALMIMKSMLRSKVTFPRLVPEYVVGFAILFSIAHYFLFYNKKRWASYEKEFKDESPEERRRGKIYVLAYLIGSAFSPMILALLFG
ncbi:MAG: hypothetical protein JO154_05335 [Chitinophaga sp.]|uniref:hypothetical protein n=1 Tax=Chitinophaga sp. TaxID=1869181 RepID=UPI0025BE84EB|nr:hypothetical protein [Chitinophaga sp.]MBV8252011.1 hypothetical protein [Chitinophaga sp.]